MSQRPFCPDVSTFQTYEPIRISWVGAISLRAGGPLRLANLLLILFTCVYYTCTYRKGGGRKRPAVCVSGSVVLCGYAICFVVVIHRRSFTFIFESHTLIRLFSTYTGDWNTIIIYRLAQMRCEPSSTTRPPSQALIHFLFVLSSVNGTLENCDLFALP